MRRWIPEEEEAPFFKTVLGTAAIVWVYAVLHDQYLIRVAHQHFTLYRPQIFPFDDITLLAIGYATVAATGPGLLLGYAFYAVCRLGPLAKLQPKAAWQAVVIIVLVTESISVSGGWLALWLDLREAAWFPVFLYPDLSGGIIVTQSTQLLAYGNAMLWSVVGLGLLYRRRMGVLRAG